MKETIKNLKKVIREVKSTLKEMSEKQWNKSKEKGKWSKRKILGHLVDSAQNNIRRFVVTQYQLDVPHIIYDQEKWVELQGYKDYPTKDLLQLWLVLNDHLIRLMENMPEENYEKLCNTGKIFSEQHTLAWLAEDYVNHMKHHLGQIIS